MATSNNIEDTQIELADLDRGRSKLAIAVSIIVAIAVTCGLSAGYMYLRRLHAEKNRAAQQTQSAAPVAPLEAQIFTDDAMLKGSKAVISGTVLNISHNLLSDLSLDIELTRRTDSSKEVHSLTVEPKDLAPDEQGRYSLTVPREYSSARLLRLKSGGRSADVAFKTAPGAQRPPERTPETSKTIVIKRTKPRSGEEFINTPDNPTNVP